MAAKLTDHTWTVKEMLTPPRVPDVTNTQEGDYRKPHEQEIQANVGVAEGTRDPPMVSRGQIRDLHALGGSMPFRQKVPMRPGIPSTCMEKVRRNILGAPHEEALWPCLCSEDPEEAPTHRPELATTTIVAYATTIDSGYAEGVDGPSRDRNRLSHAQGPTLRCRQSPRPQYPRNTRRGS